MDNKEIFGEKAKELEKSPENLSDYIHVTSPGIWVLLIGMIVLFAGAFVWSAYGSIEQTVRVYAYSRDGRIACYVGEDNRDVVAVGQTVKLEGKEGKIISESVGSDGELVCDVEFPVRLPDGVYIADIVIQQIKPISLITN